MIGKTLSHFKVTAKLGKGGMGEVYQAQDTSLDRDVAIKVLPPELASDPDRLARFGREAKTLAALDHPNIVQIFSVDSAMVDGRVIRFLTMQLVRGRCLSELIPQAGMELEEIFRIAVPLAEALAAAHDAGIVHRDLKPANIMLTEDARVKVLDFGLAKLQQSMATPAVTELPTEPLTREGSILGTVPYMSPEQLEGKELDPRSDIFSLGVILYEMATGERPFQGQSSASLISSIMKDQPRDVDLVRENLPHHLGRIIRRCLEKEPKRRYQAALDIHNELSDLQKEMVSSITSSLQGSPTEVSVTVEIPPGRSRRALWGLAGAVILAAVAAAYWLGYADRSSDVTSRPAIETAPAALQSATLKETEAPSIAVLPFADMSPDRDQEYFSDGLAEELLNLLARVDGLKVAARTSSFSFKGKDVDITTIAENLNVTTILEGSVRKAGNRVRITAQLVNAADGFHLWSDTFDRELDDVFLVQDEIAQSVVKALQLTLLGGPIEQPPSRSHDIEAYNLYLQGKFFAQRRLGMKDYARAIDSFERAVALDPDYAQAWSGLAYARNNQTGDGYVDYDEGHSLAVQAVERALELDENLAEGWAVLGEIKTELEWDWAGARQALERARELAPEEPGVIRRQAELAYSTGDLDLSIELARRSAELDPLNYLAYSVLGAAYWAAGRLDEAERAGREILALNPDSETGPRQLAEVALARSQPETALEYTERLPDAAARSFYHSLACHAMGRDAEARDYLQQYIESDGSRPAKVAEIHAVMGETDLAFDWLARAFSERDAVLADAKSQPRLASLRDDPRWLRFLKKMNLTTTAAQNSSPTGIVID